MVSCGSKGTQGQDSRPRKTKGGSFISFFFNARRDEPEKSTTGMYWSLLLQLLDTIPRLQAGFSSLGRTARYGNIPRWSIESLKSFFRHTVQNLEQSPLTYFIDALDEWGVNTDPEMISFFGDVGEMAVSRDMSFRV
ncbi:hypothetical protein G3M48_004104 [Beauveria asiatica]|uniref:Nephrocystin 3-like N-terminal domain-containing protein n=1 Tax=Beauveria asiatica TaxID=1069075 RepID=A0AAW0RUZ5_9HYPO